MKPSNHAAAHHCTVFGRILPAPVMVNGTSLLSFKTVARLQFVN
jgi:hypothetical protein